MKRLSDLSEPQLGNIYKTLTGRKARGEKPILVLKIREFLKSIGKTEQDLIADFRL